MPWGDPHLYQGKSLEMEYHEWVAQHDDCTGALDDARAERFFDHSDHLGRWGCAPGITAGSRDMEPQPAVPLAASDLHPAATGWSTPACTDAHPQRPRVVPPTNVRPAHSVESSGESKPLPPHEPGLDGWGQGSTNRNR